MTERVVFGASATIQKMTRIANRMKEAVNEAVLQDFLKDRILSRFDAEKDPNGQSWKKLEPSALARRKRAGLSSTKILYATGTLRNSIKVISSVNTGLFALNTGLGFRIGVDDKEASVYGRVHQYGLGRPQRGFMGVSNRDAVAVQAHLARRMIQIAKGG